MPAIQNAETILSRWQRKLQSYWINHFRNHVKVVLYHRVATLERDTLKLAVTPENFELHIKWLKGKYNILPIDELNGIITAKKKIPANSLLITFDDGYADNYLEALPVLEAYQAPAVFFFTTSKLGTSDEFWWDELDRLVFSSEKLPDEIRIDDGTVVNSNDRTSVFRQHHDLLKYSTPVKRNLVLENLRDQIKDNTGSRASHRIMTIDELGKFSSSPFVTIGAHTVNHISLGNKELSEQRFEMIESKKQLENIIRKPVDYFAYPYGTTKDFSSTTIQLAEEAGYKLSFVNYHGFATANTHPHKIPRILVRNWDIDEYARQLNRSF